MAVANLTELMSFFKNFTGKETNSTDSAPLHNSTAYDYEAQFPDLANNWTARFLKWWYDIFWLCLGVILGLVVMCLSLFKKTHINREFKWFMLNQALASFISSFGSLMFFLVALVGYGEHEYYAILSSSNCPLWMTIFQKTTSAMDKYGYYAQMTTLLVTVLNRFLAIAFPFHYSYYMKPRLIVLYCILPYIVLIPMDDRIHRIIRLASRTLALIISKTYELVPWIVSTVLSIVLYCRLLKRQRNIVNVVDEETLKENRSILRAVLIEITFTFFSRILMRTYDLVVTFVYPNSKGVENSWFASTFLQIAMITAPMAASFPCLAILITMRPYREAVLSYFSPLKKCFNYLSNRVVSNKVGVQTVSTQRIPVITIRSAPSPNNGGVIVNA